MGLQIFGTAAARRQSLGPVRPRPGRHIGSRSKRPHSPAAGLCPRTEFKLPPLGPWPCHRQLGAAARTGRWTSPHPACGAPGPELPGHGPRAPRKARSAGCPATRLRRQRPDLPRGSRGGCSRRDGTDQACLVVVHQPHIERIAILEADDHGLSAPDRNRVEPGETASQETQAVARQRHALHRTRLVKVGQCGSHAAARGMHLPVVAVRYGAIHALVPKVRIAMRPAPGPSWLTPLGTDRTGHARGACPASREHQATAGCVGRTPTWSVGTRSPAVSPLRSASALVRTGSAGRPPRIRSASRQSRARPAPS